MGAIFHMSLKKFNLRLLVIGHAIFHTLDSAFDYVLYPFVIFEYGPLYGGVTMLILSIFVCLFIIYVYDFLEKDLLGIETAKELVEEFFKEEEEMAVRSWRKTGKKFFAWIFHRNKLGQFIFLSLHFDPLITTIYMRPGYHLYNGLSKRDWKIFWGSAFVSNAYWTLLAFTGVSVVEKLIVKIF